MISELSKLRGEINVLKIIILPKLTRCFGVLNFLKMDVKRTHIHSGTTFCKRQILIFGTNQPKLTVSDNIEKYLIWLDKIKLYKLGIKSTIKSTYIYFIAWNYKLRKLYYVQILVLLNCMRLPGPETL